MYHLLSDGGISGQVRPFLPISISNFKYTWFVSEVHMLFKNRKKKTKQKKTKQNKNKNKNRKVNIKQNKNKNSKQKNKKNARKIYMCRSLFSIRMLLCLHLSFFFSSLFSHLNSSRLVSAVIFPSIDRKSVV